MRTYLEIEISILKQKVELCQTKHRKHKTKFAKQAWKDLADLYGEHISELEKVLKNITYDA